jgi:hypothetical protein
MLNSIRNWINAMVAVPGAADPLQSMSARELADLPVSHPAADPRRR